MVRCILRMFDKPNPIIFRRFISKTNLRWPIYVDTNKNERITNQRLCCSMYIYWFQLFFFIFIFIYSIYGVRTYYLKRKKITRKLVLEINRYLWLFVLSLSKRDSITYRSTMRMDIFWCIVSLLIRTTTLHRTINGWWI